MTASAPGKTILTGEHFVVYGEPAIVMAINREVRVTVEETGDDDIYVTSNLGISGIFEGERFKSDSQGKHVQETLKPIKIAAETVFKALNKKCGLDVSIHSDLPVAVGLGSSGALAVATVTAVGKLLGTEFTKEEIVNLSFEAEKYVHLNPSGIDQSIATYGGVIVYDKNSKVTRLDVASAIPLVIGNTGIFRNTGKLVEGVRLRREKFPEVIVPLIHAGGELTRDAIEALKNGNLTRLGELMDVNHGLLMAIGVSNEALDKLVNAAKRGEALGAKLTGAGGGGCMIALSTLEKRREVAEAIREAGGIPMIAEKMDTGVKMWQND